MTVRRVRGRGVDRLASSELLLLLRRFENLERAKKALVHTHHGTRVVELSAVVGCTEKRHQLAFGEELIAVFDDLMRATDQVHVVFLQKA